MATAKKKTLPKGVSWINKAVKKKPAYSERYNLSKDEFKTSAYKAHTSGKVSSSHSKSYQAKTLAGNTSPFKDTYRTSIDTTGYAAGKPTFTLKKERITPGTLGSKYASYTKTISRKAVPKTLDKMKKGTGMKPTSKKSTSKKGK